MGVRSLLLAALLFARASMLLAADPTIRGRITDPEGLPLPGVTVSASAAAGDRRLDAVTDQNGVYLLDAPPGRYRLHVELSGFSVVDLTVDVGGAVTEEDLTLRLASHQERVTVTGAVSQPVISGVEPDAPVTVTREVVDAGMLPNSQVDDVLPLLPNVVRGPDGLIAVAGARAPQGALLVNGFNETDPVNGDTGMMLPLETVDSIEVFSGGYAAEFGRATGGVTSVRMVSGGDTLHATLTSFLPRLHYLDGHVHGVESWEPNLGVSGPIAKGRFYFSEGLSYRFDRNRFSTVAGKQDSKFDALLSWSELDVQVSPAQRLVASVALDPQRTDHAGITAFTPSASVPSLHRGGWSAGLTDRITVGDHAALEVRAGVIRTGLIVTPSPGGPYTLAHDQTTGSYFDHQDLRGDRVEAGGDLSWVRGAAHLVKAGATFERSTFGGVDDSRPVDLVDSNGTVRRAIRFLPGSRLQASAGDVGLFAQDSWTVSPAVTFNAGVRYDATDGAAGRLTPRLAGTVKLPDGGSTFGASFGWFADKLPLHGRAFGSLQSRIVDTFGSDGALVDSRLYTSTVAGPLSMPIATRWDVEFDHRFAAGWLARVRYQERRGRDELVVNTIDLSETSGVLQLSSGGVSWARSLEATFAYRSAGAGDRIYVSYVRSRAVGNLNSFDVIEGPFREPWVQPDATGPLPADVPNRLLAWGMLRLPLRITVAPFVEIRNGFPYSALAEDWSVVGQRNGQRLPWFGALDLYVNKIFSLPFHLPDARIGIKFYSLAEVHTERDVQRDVSRPDFGTTYNPIPRDVVGVFELLWGKR